MRTSPEGECAGPSVHRDARREYNGSDAEPLLGASLLPFIAEGEMHTNQDLNGLRGNSPMNKSERPMDEKIIQDVQIRDGAEDTILPLSFLLHGGKGRSSETSTTENGSTSHPHKRKRQRRKRILLRGPPRSGKSSMAMNLAYCEAAANHECCGGLPCDCIAAIIYRPNAIQTHNNVEEENEIDQFPLFCRPLLAEFRERSSDQNPMGDVDDQHFTETRTVEKQEDEESQLWDSRLLKKIRISRVSSVRDLWWDLFVLGGKPVNEQPTRAIIIEDLDIIIGGANQLHNENALVRNHFGKNKSNDKTSALLKTLAIAADTALVMGNTQRPSRSNSNSSDTLTLLVTVGTKEYHHHRDSSRMEVKSYIPITKDSSDILTVASCIDTVVTLQSRVRETGECERDIHSSWTKSKVLHTPRNDKRGMPKRIEEAVVVHSLWEAEFQEQIIQEDDRSGNEAKGTYPQMQRIEYAFVESRVHGQMDNDDMDEFNIPIELRWKNNDPSLRL